MRRRLTVSFVLVGLALVVVALLVRAYTAAGSVRDHESASLRSDVANLALLVQQREAGGRPVDQAWLAGLIGAQRQVTVTSPSGSVTATGSAYGDGDGPLTARVPLPAATGADTGEDPGGITLRETGAVVTRLASPERGTLAWLLVLVALVAGVAGYAVAWLLSAPFVRLEGAARQLGRGRFELHLPRTRIPEAAAIGQALLAGAGQLQERLANEQAFAEHASHVLRTPLTGMRLELEEIAAREDLPTEVREAVARSVGQIETMDAVAGELVALSRRGGLVSGAQVALRDLATQCAQAWADALAEQDRSLSAAVEGDLETTYTPGPVEHVLDLLLADTLAHGHGSVRLVLEAADDGHLEIDVVNEGSLRPTGDPAADLPLAQARTVIAALGGRLRTPEAARMTVLLPRR